MTTVINDMYDM